MTFDMILIHNIYFKILVNIKNFCKLIDSAIFAIIFLFMQLRNK